MLVLVSALVATPRLDAAGPDDYHLTGVIKGPNVPPAGSWSFDIGFVDSSTGNYLLGDRSNKAIDLVNAGPGTFTGFIGKGSFTGNAACGGSPFGGAGPDGVVTDSLHQVWAGDGNSTIKVMPQIAGAAITKSIATGGVCRADELSYDPRDQLILIANDVEGFLTFINVSTQTVAGHFYYSDNTVGAPASVPGHATAGGGLEQSVWDPQTGLLYQAVPAGSGQGFIDVFDPVTETLVRTMPVPGCSGGPTGLALDPTHQHFIGACGNGGDVIDAQTGAVLASIPQVGGADEVWFNSGDKHYYLAEFGGQLGVVDANSNNFLQNVPTGPAAHSVAAFASNPNASNPANNKIFVPVGGSGINVYQR